jgi:F0F1-type ATP synthase assembly protein I
MLSAWGAILVVASFLFLFVGIWVDAALDTGPFFMLGLLILAVFLVMGRLYMQFRKTNDRMGNIRRRHA